MPDIHTRDAVIIPDLNGYTIPVYPPLYIRATTENIPARIDRAEFSKEQAELLARTVAPQLFEPQGPGPWEAIYNDLTETSGSYERELNTSQAGSWTAEQVQDSLGTLLAELREALREMRKLLPE